MRRNPVSLVLLVTLLLVAAVLTGCSGGGDDAGTPAPEGTFPVTVTDDAGRQVTIAAKPERVVSLAPSNTEIVYALGALDRLFGVTTFDDYPAEVADIAKIGDVITPNLEVIASIEPDLVLATGGVQEDTIGQLEALGATVLVIDPQSLEGVYAAIVLVGDAIGEPAKALEVRDSMKLQLEDVQGSIENAPVRCFIEIAQDPLFTAGAGTYLDDIIAQAGGENVVTEEGWVAYSVEQLLALDPEVYLATKGSMSDPADIGKRQGYSSLAAVRDGRVYVLDDNLVSRPGPRVIEGIRQIAEALHPDAFVGQ